MRTQKLRKYLQIMSQIKRLVSRTYNSYNSYNADEKDKIGLHRETGAGGDRVSGPRPCGLKRPPPGPPGSARGRGSPHCGLRQQAS